MKADFLFAGLNLNRAIQKRSARKKHILWMMLYKQGALYVEMLRLGYCLPPLIKISGNPPGCNASTLACCQHTVTIIEQFFTKQFSMNAKRIADSAVLCKAVLENVTDYYAYRTSQSQLTVGKWIHRNQSVGTNSQILILRNTCEHNYKMKFSLRFLLDKSHTTISG